MDLDKEGKEDLVDPVDQVGLVVDKEEKVAVKEDLVVANKEDQVVRKDLAVAAVQAVREAKVVKVAKEGQEEKERLEPEL